MAARARLTVEETAFVLAQRVARLATVAGGGHPHVVPICFAFDGERFYTPLDEKPKRVGDADLRRVRNILETGHAALVVDRYNEDWSRLAYVLVRGRARLLELSQKGHADALGLLRERYPQYRTMALEERAVIAITPERVVSWGAVGAPDTGET